MENDRFNTPSKSNDSSVDSSSGGLQIVDRGRLGLRRRLVNLLKFLLFREDNPKHNIWQDFSPLDLALLFTFEIPLSIAFVIYGFVFFGVIGFFVAYITFALLAIEIPHCIFDR